MILVNNIPPTAPAMPPNPTTDPTARRGNMSDENVKRFADQPWCAAAATLTRPTATQRLSTYGANITGTTSSAQTSIAVLRAAFTDHPRLISADDSQPPPMLPTSATR